VRDDLPHAMRETARRLEPDVVRLAAGGVSRGTRMRRIERIVQVLGSVLAVAVVFAGVALFGQHRTESAGGGGETNQPAVSGAGNTSGTGTPSPSNALAPATTPSSTGVPWISGTDLISTLKSCLGGTGVTGRSFVARGSDYVWPPSVAPASVFSVSAQLAISDQVGSISIDAYGAQDSKSVPKLGKPEARGDGSVVYVSQESGSSDGRHSDRIDLDVTLVRTDGSSLFVVETNAANAKSAAPTGATLLLSPDQVLAMVDSPAWDAALAAADTLPFSPETPATAPPDATGAATSTSGLDYR
jgi:hypothetical protein